MRIPVLASVSAVAFLLSNATAQSCTSVLGATWDPVTTTLSTTLTGAPASSPTMTFVGLTPGTTTMHGVTLGLQMPFYVMFFGLTDANGALNGSLVLSNAPSGVTGYLQSVTMDMGNHTPGQGHGNHGHSGPMTMTFCVSNVAQVQFP